LSKMFSGGFDGLVDNVEKERAFTKPPIIKF
jgi:hypothetical protein